MQQEFIHFFINQFVSEKDAKISVHDLGFCRSYAIFDVLRTYKKKPFHLQNHLERFFFACNLAKINISYSQNEISRFVYELIELNNLDYCSLKLLATGGISYDGFSPPKMGNLYILYYPISEKSKDPIKVITTHSPRVFPHIKTTFYLPALIEMQEATARGFDDIVYVDDNNYLLEGSRSNLFAIEGNNLITPSNKVLKGITKEVIKKIAAPYFTIIERDIHQSELSTFDELFLSASVSEIRRIEQIDHLYFHKMEKTAFIKQLFHSYINQTYWEPLSISWGMEKTFLLNH